MKSKATMISISVFVIVFVLFITISNLFNNDYKYSCTDLETNTTYKFNSKEAMHKVCDKFTYKSDNIEDVSLNSYSIYSKLIEVDDRYGFSFEPYINSDNKLAIIIRIINCNNQELAINNSKQWFKNNGYSMDNYVIEYEYPCE